MQQAWRSFRPHLRSIQNHEHISLRHKSRHFSIRSFLRSSENSSANVSNGTKPTRFDRLLLRTPRFLHRHLHALRSAPVTHITAFLILHELTAIIPLFGLAGAFHYYRWLPPFFAEGEWVLKGVEMFGRYFRRKGWIADEDEQAVEREARKGEDMRVVEQEKGKGGIGKTAGKWFGRGEGGTRLVVEFATAYAVVKAFMPLRLIVSAWGAPWFARWTVVPVGNAVKRLFRRNKPTT